MSRTALLLVLFSPSFGASLGFDSKEFEAAETEDQNFLATQWRALESDMQKLQKEFAIEEAHNSGFLQIRTSPVAKAGTAKVETKEKAQAAETQPKDASKPKAKSEPKKVAAKLEPAEAAKSEPKKLAAKPESSEQSKAIQSNPTAKNRLNQAENMMKGLTGTAMLAPMLGMLNEMYADQKKRIGDINKREQKSKERFAKQQADFNAQIKEIKLRHDNHKLSDEFFKNETHDYTRQFKYWEGVRSRNHRQFHNALKITHGMMQREKDMIKQYETAMSMNLPGDAGKKTKAAVPAKPEEAPEVVLMQQRKAAAAFIQGTLVEVRRHLAETLAGRHVLSL